MIQTWIADVSPLYKKEIYLQYYYDVPVFRQEKADRLQKHPDRALSIGAWVLLQRMEKEYSLQKNCLYNISHSGRCVLCSVEDKGGKSSRLGCDLEEVKLSWNRKVAERFFRESEFCRIRDCGNEEEKRELFFRYWVLKESFLKATRMGLSLGMDSFEIGFSDEDKPYLMDKPQTFWEEYYFREYAVDGLPYRIAVCADCKDFAPKIRVATL